MKWHVSTITLADAEALANMFRAEVARVTSADERVWIAAENARRRATGDIRSCASHDIYDSNESMDAAFSRVFGRDIDASSDDDARIVNRAWRIAFP